MTGLVCQVGAVVFALPISKVSETMRPLPLRPLERARPFDCGEATIRGEAATVLDAGLLLGQAAASHGRWVTLKAGGRTVALAVDAVLGVMPAEWPVPLLGAGAPASLEAELKSVLLEARRLGAEAAA